MRKNTNRQKLMTQGCNFPSTTNFKIKREKIWGLCAVANLHVCICWVYVSRRLLPFSMSGGNFFVCTENDNKWHYNFYTFNFKVFFIHFQLQPQCWKMIHYFVMAKEKQLLIGNFGTFILFSQWWLFKYLEVTWLRRGQC